MSTGPLEGERMTVKESRAKGKTDTLTYVWLRARRLEYRPILSRSVSHTRHTSVR